MPQHIPHKVVIEGISGGGKSTAALEAAASLSEAYPSNGIAVVDSTGLHNFLSGEEVGNSWQWLDSVKPEIDKRHAKARLIGFTLLRRAAESFVGENDIIIGVRDPFRIEPAAYSTFYGPGFIRKMSTEARLRFFDMLTISAHPDAIIHLDASPNQVIEKIEGRSSITTDETEEKLNIVADELPLVLEGYRKLYDRPVVRVDAFTPTTSSEVAGQVERFLTPAGARVFVPDTPTAISH